MSPLTTGSDLIRYSHRTRAIVFHKRWQAVGRSFRQAGLALASVLLVAGCVRALPPPPAAPPIPAPAPPPEPVIAAPLEPAVPLPAVQREMRAVWVATVDNIDWPSRRDLTTDQQKAELLAILDRAVALRLNAIIFQVRPGGDALYSSTLEPWSEYLTGQMGRAPEPFYDPLAFAIEEAHRRGLELHAWFNPYRARHPSARSPIADSHLSRANPALVRTYGTHLWMDPGEQAVQDHSVSVILDVVRRYDVDGIHIDDYFYPYRERDRNGNLLDFPDNASYARYLASGGTLARGDWRRRNVDTLVERLHREIKQVKGWVRFGISPFGIWRPGFPPQIRGFDAYDQIYADSRKWLVEGWVDYFVPQLYWPIARVDVSFPVLLRWWAEHNLHSRHLWPGLIPNNIPASGSNGWSAREILGQIYVSRGQVGVTGVVHFSMRSLMMGRDSLTERLAVEAYPEPALVPATPWLSTATPTAPRLVRYDPASGSLFIAPEGGEPTRAWVVRTRRGDAWTSNILPPTLAEIFIDRLADEAFVTGVGRTGLEGPALRFSPQTTSCCAR